MAGRLCARIAGKPADRARAVLGQNRTASDRPLSVELREPGPERLGRFRLLKGDLILLERADDTVAREHRRTRDDGCRRDAIDTNQRAEADGEFTDQMADC